MLSSRRSRRATAVLAVGLSGVLALSGCRSDPGVAAYVGQQTVTTSQLGRAVDQRLADPAIAAHAQGDEAGFTRQVLGLLVQEDVYQAVAEHYDVHISDGEVQARIRELLAGNDQATAYTQLAQKNGVSRHDVEENVRQQLLREKVAAATGAVDTSESALRARYDKTKAGLATYQLGVITVPDQATADRVLAQLTQDPASYPGVAAQYASQNTLPAVTAFTASDVPQVLLTQVESASPGTGFTLPVPQAGGIVVTFVAGVSYPAFEDVRAQLAASATSDAAAAGTAAVTTVQKSLRVRVNPRYGVLRGTDVVPPTGGVVDLLGSTAAPAAAPSGAPAGG